MGPISRAPTHPWPPIPVLPSSACRAHEFPSLHSHSLLSIGQLCDHECKSVFTNHCITITLHDIILLTGTRSTTAGGIWTVYPIKPTTTHAVQTSTNPITSSVKVMFHTTLAHDTIANCISFYHASLFSPALSTWCHAIDTGHFTTWPGITSSAVRKCPPQSIPMHQGHLDQVRANIRSTRQPTLSPPTSNMQQPTTDAEVADDMAPPEESTTHTWHVYTNCRCTTSMVYTDPIGKVLVPSVSGDQYVLVVYEYNGNYIHAEPMIGRTYPSIISAYQRSIAFLQSRGFKPLLQHLNDEATGVLQEFLDTSDIDFQWHPPMSIVATPPSTPFAHSRTT
jgi:hypothetical protein